LAAIYNETFRRQTSKKNIAFTFANLPTSVYGRPSLATAGLFVLVWTYRAVWQ